MLGGNYIGQAYLAQGYAGSTVTNGTGRVSASFSASATGISFTNGGTGGQSYNSTGDGSGGFGGGDGSSWCYRGDAGGGGRSYVASSATNTGISQSATPLYNGAAKITRIS